MGPAGGMDRGPALVTTAGSWDRAGATARFTPRFGAVPGTTFIVVGRQDVVGDSWRELARVDVSAADLVASTVVESIDPGVDSVPANLLRFSVTFSTAMEEGSAAGRIQLLDGAGAALPGTLLDMPPELWDRDRRRLTVLLEPGRIKRGLQPNVQAGPPLREGGEVTLVVDSGIRDEGGSPLLAGTRRTFRIGAPIRSRIDPALWDVQWPVAQADALVVRFDRSLDRALVRRCLRVLDGNGHPVLGEASLDRDAQLWVFTAAAAASRDWTLAIDTRLEDLAGNSVRRMFDRDLQNPEDDGIDVAEILLAPQRDDRALAAARRSSRSGFILPLCCERNRSDGAVSMLLD